MVFFDAFAAPETNLLVWASPREDVEVIVNGASMGVVAAGTRSLVPSRLWRRSHVRLRHLRSGRVRESHVFPTSAARTTVLPTHDDQCFAEARVRPRVFEPPHTPSRLVRRFRAGGVFHVTPAEPMPTPQVTLVNHELAHRFEPGIGVNVVAEVPCSVIDADEHQVLRHVPRAPRTAR